MEDSTELIKLLKTHNTARISINIRLWAFWDAFDEQWVVMFLDNRGKSQEYGRCPTEAELVKMLKDAEDE